MKIAFIGPFNPVTMAHLTMANVVCNEIADSKVIFIPVSDYYDKDSLKTKASERLKMLEIATRGNERFEVSDVELVYAKEFHRQPKTYDTLLKLSETNDDVALLIGMDNYFQLYWWYRIEDILSKHKVIVYPRLSNDEDVRTMKIYDKFKDSFIFIDTDIASNISSSIIRDNFVKNKSNKYLVEDNLLHYIYDNIDKLGYK